MAKLYCILARAADTAVIFRRGPSKQTRLIWWNLETHRFEPGQWFEGQIYARKSDLSPDGQKLVYFAAKFYGDLETWVAVSSPPFLTAHVLWRVVGTWDEISLFETDTVLALATHGHDSSLVPEPGFAMPRQLRVKVKHKVWPGYFHILADHDRLVRDGWKVHAGNPVFDWKAKGLLEPVLYRQRLAGGTNSAFLEMAVSSDGKSIVYRLFDGWDELIDLKADWAEVRGKNVFFSQGGNLLAMRIVIRGNHVSYGPTLELADFSDMKFEPLKPPDEATIW